MASINSDTVSLFRFSLRGHACNFLTLSLKMCMNLFLSFFFILIIPIFMFVLVLVACSSDFFFS